MCENPTWITYAINVILCIAALLAVYVMQRAEKDQSINRVDNKWFRAARRMSFIAVAMFAGIVMLTNSSPLSQLGLYTAATVLLLVDAIALNHRPPHRGLRSAAIGHGAVAWAPLRHLLAIFFRPHHD